MHIKNNLEFLMILFDQVFRLIVFHTIFIIMNDRRAKALNQIFLNGENKIDFEIFPEVGK